jgi:hypothetical protein
VTSSSTTSTRCAVTEEEAFLHPRRTASVDGSPWSPEPGVVARGVLRVPPSPPAHRTRPLAAGWLVSDRLTGIPGSGGRSAATRPRRSRVLPVVLPSRLRSDTHDAELRRFSRQPSPGSPIGHEPRAGVSSGPPTRAE